MLDATESLDVADELIIMLAKIIVIAVAALYFEETAGMLILLGVAWSLVRTDNSAGPADSPP